MSKWYKKALTAALAATFSLSFLAGCGAGGDDIQFDDSGNVIPSDKTTIINFWGWADKYEEYLGIRPENASEGVLQDIHWSQGSFGYFPSYALGSAFGAQLYYHMKKEMDFEGLLERGEIGVIREYLRENVHRFGKLKTSREILKDTTGEDFNPKYYIQYLKEKYSRLYDL